MKEQLIELLEMKDNRMADLERQVFELKAQLAEARGLLDEIEHCWENRMFALNMPAFDKSGNPLPNSPSHMDAILAKRKGGADGEEEGT